jgi:dihydroorotate dehydrogenase
LSDLREMSVTMKGITLPYPVMIGGGVMKTAAQAARYAATDVVAEWGSITTDIKTGNGGRDYYAHYEKVNGQRVLQYALNSIGLTNPSMAQVEQDASHLLALYKLHQKPLPINISGENLDDTLALMKRARACGFPIITVNTSCPNKRGKESRPIPVMCFDTDTMSELITRADKEIGATDQLIMLKVSTGLPITTLANICTLLKASETFDGITTGNTQPNGFAYTPQGVSAIQTANGLTVGGVSGPAIKPVSLSQTKFAADFFGDQKIVWGCGGVMNADDVLEYLRVGARVVQLVTAFRENEEDPVFIRNLLENLVD